MTKIVPEPVRVEMVKPVTVNINPALVIARINTFARVPATPVAQVPPAVENIFNVCVRAVMSGKTESVVS